MRRMDTGMRPMAAGMRRMDTGMRPMNVPLGRMAELVR
jgi:hypothetical protein